MTDRRQIHYQQLARIFIAMYYDCLYVHRQSNSCESLKRDRCVRISTSRRRSAFNFFGFLVHDRNFSVYTFARISPSKQTYQRQLKSCGGKLGQNVVFLVCRKENCDRGCGVESWAHLGLYQESVRTNPYLYTELGNASE